MTTFTMVGFRKASEKDKTALAYTLIDGSFNIVNLTAADVASGIASKKFVVTNMEFVGGELKVSNGAASNYTRLIVQTNQLIPGKAVILNRIERNGKLAGYVVYDTYGTIREVTVADAVEMYNKLGGFANGKIRHTADGDIISSISGNYPLIQVSIESKSASGKVKVLVNYITKALGETKSAKFAGVILDCENVATLSNLYKKLGEGNKALKAALKELGADEKQMISIETCRITETMLFFIVKATDLQDLCALKAKDVSVVPGFGDHTFLSCIDYTTGDESIVKFGAGFDASKAAEAINGGSKRTKQGALTLAVEVMNSTLGKTLTARK